MIFTEIFLSNNKINIIIIYHNSIISYFYSAVKEIYYIFITIGELLVNASEHALIYTNEADTIGNKTTTILPVLRNHVIMRTCMEKCLHKNWSYLHFKKRK